MILEDKTKEQFGYFQSQLSPASTKKFVVSCDYCGVEFLTSNNPRKVAHKTIQKDSCKGCQKIKTREANLARYGVTSPSKLSSVKEKVARTSIERRGVRHYLQSEEGKAKFKETCLSKYGVENPSSLEDVKEKRKSTCLEKFGKETYLGSEDCLKKTKETIGTDNVFQLESVKEKSKITMLSKYGVDNMMKLPEVRESNVIKCRQTKIDRGILNLYEGKTKSDWAKDIGFSRSRFSVLVKENGWDLAVKMTPRISSLEIIVEEWLKELGVEYTRQAKIGKYYADFTIGNLAIELNGNYWHSEIHKQADYHVKKREFYIQNGYSPIFFTEDEITTKFDIVKSVILNKLGKSSRLFARKLKVGEVGKKEGSEFLQNNHLMGKGRGELIGLYQNDDLVSLMQLRRVKGNNWEISRFCNVTNTTVVGGFSKILSFFTEKFAPDSLMTFIDLRYGSGEYLSEIGFKKIKAFKSFKWTDGSSLFHRMMFPSNSGYDKGLYKVWDCGQLKFIKTY
jgi:very-short-patch-repair endonuclease